MFLLPVDKKACVSVHLVCLFELLSYPAGNCGISQCFAHQVTQQCVGPQETQADIGGFGEFPQNGRVGKIHGSRSPVNQGHHNLCVKGTYTVGEDTWT